MTKLLYAASAAAILTIAGHMPAMAQSSMSAPMITCRDLTTMDRETARSVVFYMSGFRAASGSQSAAGRGTTGSGSGTSYTSGSTAADAGSSTSGSSGSTTGTASDTTGSTTAAGGSSGSSDTSGTSASGSASGASGGASSTMVAQLPGFSGIDVDKIMTECASSPDKQISDMVGTGSIQ